MQRLFERPKLTYIVLVVAIVGFFALSAVGNTGKHDTNVTWIGDTGWWLFVLSLLTTIMYSIALLVRGVARSRRATS